MKLHIYEIDDGEQHWYAAASADDALRLHVEPLVKPGTDLSDLPSKVIIEDYMRCSMDEIDICEVPEDKLLKIHNEDDGQTMEMTAAQWVSYYGEGLIGSTAY